MSIMRRALTLGLDEDTLVDTGLEGTVEERVEHGVGLGLDVVVGLHVLLEALSAVGRMLALVLSHIEAESRWPHAPNAGHETHEGRVGVGAFSPRSIAVLELQIEKTRQ